MLMYTVIETDIFQKHISNIGLKKKGWNLSAG